MRHGERAIDPGARALRGTVASWLDRHLFLVRQTEPLPAVLGHRRIFVLPTGPGMAFAAVLTTMLLGAMNYNLSLGYGLCFLLAGVGTTSMIHAFRNLVHLELRAVRMPPVHCGQPATLYASFESRAPRRRDALMLRTRGAAAVGFAIPPNGTATAELTMPTSRRGWLDAGRLILETRYPLGLIRAWSVLTPGARCLVYPSPEFPPQPFPSASADTAIGFDGAQGGDDFAGLREYRAGDAPRHIAWKLAARHENALHTKLFRGGQELRQEFDWFALPQGLDVEARLSRLTRWVLDADQGQSLYGLRLPGERIEPGCGESHRDRCLRALALHGLSDAT